MLVIIFGAGESGVGAALLAQAKGYAVCVLDQYKIKSSLKASLQKFQIPFMEQQKEICLEKNIDFIVKSPGIPNDHPWIILAKKKYIKILDEIEFASYHISFHSKIIAITGSNGKSTTVHLLYHFLKKKKKKVALVGNVGKSFSRQLFENSDYDYFVVEISSFQLEYIHTFKPHIAAILNISPDHLDRYQYDLQKYIKAKWRIIQNMSPTDYFVYHKDEKNIDDIVKNHPSLTSISIASDPNYPFLYCHVEKKKIVLQNSHLQCFGLHYHKNVCLALTIINLLGIPLVDIQPHLSSFRGLPHRLEYVGHCHQVDIYNDAKATNVDAVYRAICSFDRPIVWIAGGIDKGNDYTVLLAMAAKKIRSLICLGKDNILLKQSFQEVIPYIFETTTMLVACQKAFTLAHRHDVILLSPACASFDLYKNFEAKGNDFKKNMLFLIQSVQ